MIFAALTSGLHRVPAAAMAAAFAMVSEDARCAEPLMLAAASGAIDCITINDPVIAWPCGYLRKATRPVVVLIGDDPGNPAGHGGPSAWRCAAKAAAWAAGVIVHGAGGRPEHYKEAVIAAPVLQRIILIETTSTNAIAWRDAIRCPRTLMILCRDTHPVDSRVLH